MEERPILFGDWLIRRGLIDRNQLFVGLSHSHQNQCRIGDALVGMDVLARDLVEEEARAHSNFVSFLEHR